MTTTVLNASTHVVLRPVMSKPDTIAVFVDSEEHATVISFTCTTQELNRAISGVRLERGIIENERRVKAEVDKRIAGRRVKDWAPTHIVKTVYRDDFPPTVSLPHHMLGIEVMALEPVPTERPYVSNYIPVMYPNGFTEPIQAISLDVYTMPDEA